ncbi:MAG: hypothetical protein K2P93_02645 [Alphaproteobacteria bacterium]|nr:hypothetical protein [Alphaproteobacteria bacterium]
MNESFSLRIAELLTSRLCHDLITPIGAINTGLELFQETPSDHLTESSEILKLILHSSQTASARVSFFRVAFGSSIATVSLGEARQLIDKYFIRSKLTIHWSEPFQSDLVLEWWGRILLNSVLWMSECAPRGGTLSILAPRKDHLVLSLHLDAESIILHQGTLEALEGKASLKELTPRTIPCYLIHRLVEERKGKLSINKTPSLNELFLEIKAPS